MLEFLLAADWKAASQTLLSRLTQRTDAREGGQILLVPEQISFETERRLCRLGGDGVCRYAEVLSFSRLAERVSSEYGGVALRYLDKGGRLLAAAQAVEQVLSRIKLFASVCRKPEFLESFLQAVEEFGNYGLSADTLREAAKGETGQFAQKLEELSLLLESYEAVTAQAQDPVCRLQHLRDTLAQEDYAVGKSFYLYGFTDFTRLELEIVRQLILSAERVVIALPQETVDGEEIFASALETRRSLAGFADANNVEVKTEAVPFSAAPEDLLIVHQEIVKPRPQQYPHSTENAFCISARDKDGECRAAISEIRRLLEKGARLRDIAIACQDEQTLPLLESMLQASELPYFISGKQPLSEHSGARTVLCAVRAAATGFEREDVTDYLKSGATELSADDCDRLENYAYLWNMNGSRWEAEWTMHPRELSERWRPSDYEALSALNANRKVAIAPLSALKLRLNRAETVGQMARAVYDFMEEISLAETLQDAAESFYVQGDTLRAQQYAQVYELLQNALEQMDLILHDCLRKPDAFCRLLEKLIACYSVGAIPASADRITVGTAQDYRAREIDHFLILDADDSHFPAPVHRSGVLTEAERMHLISAGLSMAPSQTDAMERELSGAYLSIRAARKSLRLFYAGDTPSFLTRRFARICGERKTSGALLPLTAEEAASMYLQYGGEAPDHEISACAERLSQRSDYTFGAVSPESVRALYGEELSLSASKIDKFCGCRFAYFMKYGLEAKPREQARFSASEFGTFVHKVLEDTARAVMNRGGFAVVPWEEIRSIAVDAIEAYRTERLEGLSGQARFTETFRRNSAEALAVVADLAGELSRSDFAPFAFELAFGEDGKLPAVKASGSSARCAVRGYVDRADVFTKDGKTYVRVVDYKTGRKDFDYAELTIGVGMQMLIYLFALKRYGGDAFGVELQPAGVLYMPARQDFSRAKSRPTDEEAAKLQADLHRRKGLIVSSEQLIHAMEHFEDAPQYLPITEKTADVATEEEFERLERYVFRKLGEISDSIASGDVTPNPVIRSEQDTACTYCDYADVCRNDYSPTDERPIQKIKNSDFFAYLASWEDTDG